MKVPEWMRKWINRETILYLIAGALTTIVNMVVFHFCRKVFFMETLTGNGIAWVAAVLFAYVANSRWVFKKDYKGVKNELDKALKFFGARIFSLLIDQACMWLLVDSFFINDMFSKLIVNVIVVIINYIFSKLFIFK